MVAVNETIINAKAQLDKLLSNSYVEDSLLLGSLSFTQSKINNFITLELNNTGDSDYNSNELLDKIWIEFHYPVIKYFQSHFNKFKKVGKSTPVELRKLFEKFHKYIQTFNDFYLQLVKKLLTSYDIATFIPLKVLYERFDITNFDQQLKPEVGGFSVSSVVYLIHKSILSMADLSRYRSMISRNFLPVKSTTKKDQDFSEAIALYNLCILILPSLGDPFDHLAIISNVINGKFDVIYNLLRSSMTRLPTSIGFSNLIKLLVVKDGNNSILNEYKSIHNDLNYLDSFKVKFLCLFSYYFLPKCWKLESGVMVSDVPIKELEDDFFMKFMDLKYNKKTNEIIFKQVVMLMSGLHIFTNDNEVFENENFVKDSKIIGAFLKFIFRFINKFCYKLVHDWKKLLEQDLELPLIDVLRVILNWLRECKLAKKFLIQNNFVLIRLSKLINIEFEIISQNDKFIRESLLKVNEDLPMDLAKMVEIKFQRLMYFKEDITLKEFSPIGYHLKDFDDLGFFNKTEENCLQLIGRVNECEVDRRSMRDIENVMRLLSTARMGKLIICTSIKNVEIGLQFNEETYRFDIDESQERQPLKALKVSPPPKRERKEKPKKIVSTTVYIDPSLSKDKNKKKQIKSKKVLENSETALERIQETIAQYQNLHTTDDLFALIKKSKEEAVVESPKLQEYSNEILSIIKGDTTNDDEKSYSNMVSNLIEDDEENFEKIISNPSQPKPQNYQQLPSILENNHIWSQPQQLPQQQYQQGFYNQQLNFQPIESMQRQFFGQINLSPQLSSPSTMGFASTPPPPPPPQQANYQQQLYWGMQYTDLNNTNQSFNEPQHQDKF